MQYPKIFLLLFTFFTLEIFECYGQDENLVVTLTDKNYINHIESGTWLIMFYAPWCVHCKRFKPIWEELAQELQGEVNVAWADCEKEKYLQELFVVQGYPSIVFLKDGRMYEYTEERSLEHMKSFTREGYQEAESEKIPKVPSLMKAFTKTLKSMQKQIKRLVMDEPAKAAIIFAAFLIFFVIMILLCLWMVKTEQQATTVTAPKTAKKPKTN